MRHVVEIQNSYNGVSYEVILQELGHRCGYITVPEDVPQEAIESLTPHGGITFKEGNTIGFDCAHLGDAVDVEAASKAFKGYEAFRWMTRGHVWTTEEVESECKKMIDDLKPYLS